MQFVAMSLFDRKTGQFGQPMFAVSAGSIIRGMGDEVNGRGRPEGSDLRNHPEDFDLYEVGSFETSTGVFDSKNPALIVTCKDLVAGS